VWCGSVKKLVKVGAEGCRWECACAVEQRRRGGERSAAACSLRRLPRRVDCGVGRCEGLYRSV